MKYIDSQPFLARISCIKTDDQSVINELVKRYAAQIKIGTSFPPIVLCLVKGKYLIEDGYHRCAAMRLIGRRKILSVTRKWL